MADLINLFWFFSAAYWALLIFMVRVDPAPEVWPDRPPRSEIETFCRRLAVAVCGPQILLGIFQLLGGGAADRPLLLSRDLSDPWVAASLLTVDTAGLLLLGWLWIGGGDTVLARCAPAFNYPWSPRRIRWTLTGGVALGALSELLVRRLAVPLLQ